MEILASKPYPGISRILVMHTNSGHMDIYNQEELKWLHVKAPHT